MNYKYSNNNNKNNKRESKDGGKKIGDIGKERHFFICHFYFSFLILHLSFNL